jgi:hypothetical protein
VTNVRIGCGAGFAGDRLPPALDLLERGELDYLVLECLAERTIADAQARRLLDPDAGFDPLLEKRMRQLLPALARGQTRLISNMGAANPERAALVTAGIAGELGIAVQVAALTGDDVLTLIDPATPAIDDGLPLEAHGEIVSANAYLGIEHLLGAMRTDAQVVLTGRVADPSLFLAPLVLAHQWDIGDFDLMARGTVVGHLLECGPQVSGGYFADPPLREVPGLADVGYPLAEVAADGSAVVTKLCDTGGMVTRDTVIEQLMYEITDPHAYVTPDVIADFSNVDVVDQGSDRVRVEGARGSSRPEQLKVSVGYRAGFTVEGEISYAGRGAVERGRLACELVRDRLPGYGELRLEVARTEVLDLGADRWSAPGCRVRIAARVTDRVAAERVADEVLALYTSGPAGGGGVRTRIEETIGIASTLIPRGAVTPHVFVSAGVPA